MIDIFLFYSFLCNFAPAFNIASIKYTMIWQM